LRELIASLVKTFRRCHSTVLALMNSSAPISGFVRPSVPSKPCDVLLLGGELVTGIVSALAHLLAGGQQLASSPVGESICAHRGEHVVRIAELLTRVDPPVLPAEPLSVGQSSAGQVSHHPTPAEAVDRLAVELLGCSALLDKSA